MGRLRRSIWLRRGVVATVCLLGVIAVIVLIPVFVLMRELGARNDALPNAARRELTQARGSTRTVLLLGSDRSRARANSDGAAFGTADTMLLARVDPSKRRVDLLSIPRDYRVDGRRLGAAFADGGAAGAIRSVRRALGIEIHHVAVVDFDGFRRIVDTVGPIELENPFPLRSGAGGFDGRSWSFRGGELQLEGRAALAYARIRRVDQRSALLNPEEVGEIGRLVRQQRVFDSTVHRLTPGLLLRHPIDVPRSLVEPITTDIGVRVLARWANMVRGGASLDGLRCRLGGTYEDRGDSTYIIPTDTGPTSLAQVVRMFERRSKPLPPALPTAGGCYAH